MQQGTVKWFNMNKGFGFVLGDDGTDLFVHCSDIANFDHIRLVEGDRLEFEVVEAARGLRAVKVRAI